MEITKDFILESTFIQNCLTEEEILIIQDNTIEYLKTNFPNIYQEIENIVSNIPYNISLLNKLYSNNYDYSREEIFSVIEILNYLDSSRIIKFISVCKILYGEIFMDADEVNDDIANLSNSVIITNSGEDYFEKRPIYNIYIRTMCQEYTNRNNRHLIYTTRHASFTLIGSFMTYELAFNYIYKNGRKIMDELTELINNDYCMFTIIKEERCDLDYIDDIPFYDIDSILIHNFPTFVFSEEKRDSAVYEHELFWDEDDEFVDDINYQLLHYIKEDGTIFCGLRKEEYDVLYAKLSKYSKDFPEWQFIENIPPFKENNFKIHDQFIVTHYKMK